MKRLGVLVLFLAGGCASSGVKVTRYPEQPGCKLITPPNAGNAVFRCSGGPDDQLHEIARREGAEFAAYSLAEMFTIGAPPWDMKTPAGSRDFFVRPLRPDEAAPDAVLVIDVLPPDVVDARREQGASDTCREVLKSASDPGIRRQCLDIVNAHERGEYARREADRQAFIARQAELERQRRARAANVLNALSGAKQVTCRKTVDGEGTTCVEH